MRMRTVYLALLALLLAVGGCGARGGGDLRQLDRVPVVVENRNFYQATIFAVVNSSRVRLGEVAGNSTATLQAPAPPAGRMRVEVRLLAVGAFTSYPVSFAPGDVVQVTVPPDLHRRRPARRR
jgi:hypothetical protein